jgi:RHS repeat-associated protein
MSKQPKTARSAHSKASSLTLRPACRKPECRTKYIYDGWRVIQERDGATPVASFTRGSDLSGTLEGAGGIGGLLSRSDTYSGGNWLTHDYYFADGNGNITYLVDSSQGLAASYRYDPFGNLISGSGPLYGLNRYRFSSKEIHVGSGMYYYGYRFYDPNLQRWINRDPVEEAGGINLFSFAGNCPRGWIDAFGLAIFPPDFIGPLQPGDSRIPNPPPNIPGGPWTWLRNPQNPRGGAFYGPKGPGGRRPICTYAPAGTVNNNKDPYWKKNDGSGNTQRYDQNGNPISPDQAHPGSNPPVPYTILPTTAPDGTPIFKVVPGDAGSPSLDPAVVTPGVRGLPGYPTTFPAESFGIEPIPVPVP